MFRSLFRRGDDEPTSPMLAGRPASVPPGVCIYAVGDIHGRHDLLIEMHRRIVADAAQLPAGTEKVVLYVGDYVDRGLESRQVLDELIQRPLRGFRTVPLIGNHDAWLLSFLIDARIGPTWLRYGGDATLHSYGVAFSRPRDDLDYYEDIQAKLREQLPAGHVAFLEGLEFSHASGDYLFVHAGVRPDVPLDQQNPEDLLWIREPFLSWRRELGKIIVHGHTVEDQPIVRSNRIGIDTGACWTGCLTCLVLEERSYRFIDTGGPAQRRRLA